MGVSIVNEIYMRVGRNLLMFQKAEESLRLVLPYIHPDGSKKGAEAMREYAERNVSGETLGRLIGEFLAAVTTDGDKQLIADDLKAWVDTRNELVHNFYRKPAFNLASPDGPPAALAYLDEQYRRARDWARIFFAHAAALLLELAKTNPKLAAELAPHRDKVLALFSRSPDSDGADFFIE